MSDVVIGYHSESEHVAGTVSHAMLIAPDGEGTHRLYFAGTPLQQAQMLSVAVGYMIRTGLSNLVMLILRDNEGTDEIRGYGTPQPTPQKLP